MNKIKVALWSWFFLGMSMSLTMADLSWEGCRDLVSSDFKKEVLFSYPEDPSLSQPFRLDVDTAGNVFVTQKAIAGNYKKSRIFVIDPKNNHGKRVVGEFSMPGGGQWYGLLGMALSPDFTTKGHIYLLMTDNMSSGKLMIKLYRYYFDGQFKYETKKEIFQYGIEVQGEGHIGGDIDFDGEGNLYISTGNDSWAINKAYDAATYESDKTRNAFRTSANTNDFRGKILRIKPIAFSDAANPPPGIGSTYFIPDGNLFPVGMAKTKPEIYTMGVRNPFTIHVEKNGNLYIGDVGPGQANVPGLTGAIGGDQLYILKERANLGYPMVVHGSDPHNIYNEVTNQVTGVYDKNNLRNTSKFNTGLTVLPPLTVKAAAVNYKSSTLNQTKGKGWFPGGSMSIIVGQKYTYNPGSSSREKFPPHFHNQLIVADHMEGYFRSAKMKESGVEIESMVPFEVAGGVFSGMVDLAFGKNGSLYVIEYGRRRHAANAGQTKVSRITYQGDCLPSDSSLFPDLMEKSNVLLTENSTSNKTKYLIGMQQFVNVPIGVRKIVVHSIAGELLWQSSFTSGENRFAIPKKFQNQLLFVRFE